MRSAGAGPFNSSLYVFRARQADRIKVVWWDVYGRPRECKQSLLLNMNKMVRC
ncbi:IS66 family insertion sequence element accessory protein TnpB [Devosia naphthalenivorans]|uniref:IS66 family insertion sequence element accessory protein TnpB n=1 Tax=Devosia naphthalenivorans TaxID=2082392 RepID=UPI003CCC4510